MWKIMMVLCVLNNGVPECTTYYETNKRTFATEELCLEGAAIKFDEVYTGFNKMNIPYTRIEIGCEQKKD
jgi:hypothetical protein